MLLISSADSILLFIRSILVKFVFLIFFLTKRKEKSRMYTKCVYLTMSPSGHRHNGFMATPERRYR